jgi:hypothetical protein
MNSSLFSPYCCNNKFYYSNIHLILTFLFNLIVFAIQPDPFLSFSLTCIYVSIGEKSTILMRRSNIEREKKKRKKQIDE